MHISDQQLCLTFERPHAYSALTSDQTKLVGEEVFNKLVNVAYAYALAVKAAEDQAAADDVTTMINNLPAEVTADDAQDIADARAAYAALTDAQKALVSAETLAKLAAAEYALDPKELVNTSTLESELISTGSRLTINPSAEGGLPDYTFQIFYNVILDYYFLCHIVIANQYYPESHLHISYNNT